MDPYSQRREATMKTGRTKKDGIKKWKKIKTIMTERELAGHPKTSRQFLANSLLFGAFITCGGSVYLCAKQLILLI